MRVISWDIRGLNAPSKQRLIFNLRIESKPNILLLQETKIEEQNTVAIVHKVWKDVEFSANPSSGASGGLLCLWYKDSIRYHFILSKGL